MASFVYTAMVKTTRLSELFLTAITETIEINLRFFEAIRKLNFARKSFLKKIFSAQTCWDQL